MIVTEPITRVIGIANQDRVVPSSHDVGIYLVKLISKFSENRQKLRFSYAVGNVNTILLRYKTEDSDMLVLDDVHLKVGAFKLVKFNSYNRGHNLANFARNLISSNPYMLLVGTDVSNLDEVNEKMPWWKLLRLLRYMCLFAEMLDLYWLNWGRVIQAYKLRLRSFELI